MAAAKDILAAGIIEKDKNSDVLWTWSYPVVSDDLRTHVLAKCGFDSDVPLSVPFLYGQIKDVWYYLAISFIGEEENALPQVAQIGLVLFSKDFNPEKYSALCDIFSRQYKKTGNAADMLESYLGVVTRGVCNSDENGQFDVSTFPQQQAYGQACIKDLIQTFGVESILIYTAMLLKKRIVVYLPPHSIDTLLQFTRTIPALAWHRQNWDIVHPYLSLTPDDLADLSTHSHFVAGFTEASVEGRSDLFDLFLNVPSGQITVATHAKDSLAMGKLHKDVALFMLSQAQDTSLSDLQVIKAVASKTSELLANLKGLASQDELGRPCLTLEMLKERKMPPATENFLFNLAASEGFVKL